MARTRYGDTYRKSSEAKYNLQAFAEWSHDMAYALGLFFSDGCLLQPPHGSLRVAFYNTDLDTVKWWHSYTGNPGRINARGPRTWKSRTPSQLPDIIKGRQIGYTSTVVSDTVGDQILRLGGCHRKSRADIDVPLVPDPYLGSFLRGFFDGDGGIWIGFNDGSKGSKQLCISLTSNSALFRQRLASLLMVRGVHSVLDGISLRVNGSSAEKLCQWMYTSPGYRMARKFDVWESWQAHRAQYGGLVKDSDHWSTLRGFRPQSWHQLIGTMPDKELAKQIGKDHATVSWARQKIDAPVFKPSKQLPRHKPWHDLVGKMNDVCVSQVSGISTASVCLYRKQMGIPVFRQTEAA